MKEASVAEIKQELQQLTIAELQQLCMQLVKYKKENKQWITYALFQSFDEEGYIQQIIDEMDESFSSINTKQAYFAKKSAQKIVRIAIKLCKLSSSKETHVRVLLHYCKKLHQLCLSMPNAAVLNKLLQSHIEKVGKLIAMLHEDLQFEYQRSLGKYIQ